MGITYFIWLLRIQRIWLLFPSMRIWFGCLYPVCQLYPIISLGSIIRLYPIISPIISNYMARSYCCNYINYIFSGHIKCTPFCMFNAFSISLIYVLYKCICKCILKCMCKYICKCILIFGVVRYMNAFLELWGYSIAPYRPM